MRNVKPSLPRLLANAAAGLISDHDSRADRIDLGAGGGRAGFGSRGTRTQGRPPVTRTAPNSADPIRASHSSLDMRAYEAVERNSGGSISNFVSGFFGAVLGLFLFGILFVYGLFVDLNSVDDFFRLVIEAVAIAWFLSILVREFQSRREGLPVTVGNSPMSTDLVHGESDEIGIVANDMDSFENILSAVQSAYSREDCAALSRLLTREMMGYAEEELDRNRRSGLLNRTSAVRLLQGDVAEAWREGMTDYATVALRFQLSDVIVERETGRIILGDESKPLEASEIWTFRRDINHPWKLSAIQPLSSAA